MPSFVVNYTYTDDAAGRDQLRPEHREYLAGRAELRVSGPWVGDVDGATLIFTADGREVVEELVSHDPFVKAGLVARTDVREWLPVLGPAADGIA